MCAVLHAQRWCCAAQGQEIPRSNVNFADVVLARIGTGTVGVVVCSCGIEYEGMVLRQNADAEILP